MVNYGKYKLSLNNAKAMIEEIDCMGGIEYTERIRQWARFEVGNNSYAEVYKHIREEVIASFRQALEVNGKKVGYELDLKVGLKLYELLRPDDGFDMVKANDDDIWRYISVCVMPDLTFIRYPNQESDIHILQTEIPGLDYMGKSKPEKECIRIKKKRFYSHSRRIWLKTLWWYIHLGWQGTPDRTYEILKNNGSNIISHFIERPGRGYREKLFRCMLYEYAQLPEQKQKDKVFRAAAKLNLVKCTSVEPALTEGGEQVYSKKLFSEVVGI